MVNSHSNRMEMIMKNKHPNLTILDKKNHSSLMVNPSLKIRRMMMMKKETKYNFIKRERE
jgi:hypothetical protein